MVVTHPQISLYEGHLSTDVATVPARTKTSHLILALVLAVASVGLIVAAEWADITVIDFFPYWAAAKVLHAHGNAYDSHAIFALEKCYGAKYDSPFIMRNPPWVLFLVAPLAWLGLFAAAMLWMGAIIAAALYSIHLLKQGARIPIIVYLFAPLLVCLKSGQCTIFLLLGLALFFRYHRTRPFLAGMALILLALKPHLFLLFWPLLLLDCLRHRRLGILAGAATSFVIASGVALFLDHNVWSHYLAAAQSEHILLQYLPTVSDTLRLLIAPAHAWVQFVPALIGVAWAIREYGVGWDWRENGPLLIAVSVLVAPYSWPADQVLMLPFVLSAIRYASKVDIVALGILSVLGLAAFDFVTMNSPALVWMAPAWIIWGLWVVHQAPMRDNSNRAALQT
jgi:hypothetical protein